MKMKLCLSMMVVVTSCAWGMEKTPVSPNSLSLSKSSGTLSAAVEGAWSQSLSGAPAALVEVASPGKSVTNDKYSLEELRRLIHQACTTTAVAVQTDDVEMSELSK